MQGKRIRVSACTEHPRRAFPTAGSRGGPAGKPPFRTRNPFANICKYPRYEKAAGLDLSEVDLLYWMRKKERDVMKKTVCVLLSVLLAAMCALPVCASSADLTITNPYAGVDWDAWGAYKAQLHCHTTASDGYLTIRESVQMHYDYDYDIVAVTDHGTLNRGWDTAPDLVPLMRAVKKERTKMAPIEPLTAAEYAAYQNGTARTSAGFARTHGTGMLDVPLGLELNMATPVADCHLTGYFSEYGQGLAGVFGDYETPARGVKEAGGLSMLSHVGEYVYTKKDSEKHVGQPVDDYYANKFARIFLDNAGSCVGMGINSATDAHTRCDRILYDQILKKTIPNGVTPWAFCFSDSHNDTSVNDAYTVMLLPELTLDAFRTGMQRGTFFAVSHFTYGVELNGMAEMPGFVEEDMDWQSNQTPAVTRVEVDEANDRIAVECVNADTITWISDGNVIRRAPVENGKAEIDLHDSGLMDTVRTFVRFYITGKDGICYSQPFTVCPAGETFTPVNVPKTRDVSTFLRALVTVLDWTVFKWSPVVWAFKYFALGYDPLERLRADLRGLFQ